LLALLLLVVVSSGFSLKELAKERFLSEVPPSEYFVANEDTVVTQYGAVVGGVYETARAFYGIPYAQPPVGNLRFELPKPATPWSGTLNGKVYAPGCPQICELPPYTCTFAGTSEDCLTLDIYTPRASSQGPWPVLIFIHGGNFIQGGTGTFLYNADFLSNNTEIVVVNIQYRLGALGFFYNKQNQGNWAIHDQTLAMQWVRDNIASFGGDPTKVTIWGQSAGGNSVACHMVSPASKTLMTGAIMDSNPITLLLNTPKLMEELSSRFASLLNCSSTDLACLRSKSTSDILSAQNAAIKLYPLHPLNAFMPWQPMVDGVLIPEQPTTAFAKGNFNRVPFMAGSVTDEALLFINEAFTKPVSYDEFVAVIGLIFGPVAPKVLAQYPIAPEQMNDTRSVMSSLGTDYIFTCPLRAAMRHVSNFSVPTYYWHFDHPYTNFDPWGPDYPECVDKVCHGAELSYVFNSAEIANFFTGYRWSPDEATLAAFVSTTYGNFARSGNPNSPVNVSLAWPQYFEDSDQNMRYATPSTIESGYLKTNCDFWDSLGYTWGT